jgi:hypothetical protein
LALTLVFAGRGTIEEISSQDTQHYIIHINIKLVVVPASNYDYLSTYIGAVFVGGIRGRNWFFWRQVNLLGDLLEFTLTELEEVQLPF